MVHTAILLAGGNGTRLLPFTSYTSKHLLPVFDRPMIFYPLTNLVLLGVTKICLIINPEHRLQWESLLSKTHLDATVYLIEQEKPEGIPQAITLCEEFIGTEPFYLALGDNILLGAGLLNRVIAAVDNNPSGALIISYQVNDPQDFGVVEIDQSGELLRVIEKPKIPPSNLAVVGLYKFDCHAIEYTRSLSKSDRGEYEIADLINAYVSENRCAMITCDSASDYWLDTGTIEALTSASVFLRELKQSGVKVIANLGKSPIYK